MAERENFLERWSRRKHQANAADVADVSPPLPVAAEATPPVVQPEAQSESTPLPGSTPAAEAVFDVSKLPSLDSITAATDVRAFLAPGVPPALTRAALRRAWETDPAIRDFVGLQENDWDFNNPTAVPGFGELPADLDLKKMVGELFGKIERAPPQPPAATSVESEPAQAVTETPDTTETLPPAPVDEAPHQSIAEAHSTDTTEFVQDSKNIAMQNTVPRKHGSALPE